MSASLRPYAPRAALAVVIVAVLALAYAAIRYLVPTPFGLAMQGVRDDPVRMRALGFSVRLHRTLAFTAGTVIAALAGVLGTWSNTRISPGTIDVSQTIQLMTIAVIGGLYRMEGAWIGALVYTLLGTYTRGVTDRFETWIGVVLLVILIVSPDGISGLATRIAARVRPGHARPRAGKSVEQATPLEPGQVAQ